MSADPNSPTDYRAGVGIVLINAQGKIFAGKRRDKRDPPWQMPQGGILPDEQPIEAVRREISEELGIDNYSLIELRPDWLSYDYPDSKTSRRAVNFRGQRHLWFLLRFDGVDDDIVVDSPHGEFVEWRWRSASDIIDSVISFKQPVYRQVLRYFAPTIQRVTLAKVANPPKSLRRPRQRLIRA